MISPKEHQENYQRALAWVGEQITAAEQQGLTLDYVGGWDRFKPNTKALERAWTAFRSPCPTCSRLLKSNGRWCCCGGSGIGMAVLLEQEKRGERIARLLDKSKRHGQV